jgi:signal transduction histidine kinase
MPGRPREDSDVRRAKERGQPLLWVSGVWVLPILGIFFRAFSGSVFAEAIALIAACVAAPLPALLYMFGRRDRLLARAANAEEGAAQLKLQLETVRYRTSRLREELQAADRQARLSHQLTLLGQFTAGFMHEFNNPLAIVAGRIEVLLDERKEDAGSVRRSGADAQRDALHGNIATTLLQALRRERGGEIFAASARRRLWTSALARCGRRPKARE